MGVPRRLIFLPLLVLAGLGWLGSEAGAAPFSVRGISLGILLADFKIMPAPDRDSSPGGMPVCSDDTPSTPLSAAAAKLIHPGEAEARAGIVRCAYLHPDNGTLVPAGLRIAGVATQASFVFVPDRQGAMRLAGVKGECDSADYDKVKIALLRRYGLPQTMVRGFAYDSAGAKLQDEMVRWDNGVSQIVIDQRLEKEDVKRMAIEYRHEVLLDQAEMRLKASGGGEGELL